MSPSNLAQFISCRRDECLAISGGYGSLSALYDVQSFRPGSKRRFTKRRDSWSEILGIWNWMRRARAACWNSGCGRDLVGAGREASRLVGRPLLVFWARGSSASGVRVGGRRCSIVVVLRRSRTSGEVKWACWAARLPPVLHRR